MWVVFTDGSSNNKGSDTNVILENIFSLVMEISVRFEFATTNNQAEYEAVIVGITPAEEIGSSLSCPSSRCLSKQGNPYCSLTS